MAGETEKRSMLLAYLASRRAVVIVVRAVNQIVRIYF
jgi:hypothetical protein